MSKHKKNEDVLESEGRVDSGNLTDVLNVDTILAAEYNYAAQTAFQANEDRARVTSYYLVTVGSFLAAILSTQFITAPGPLVFGGFSLLFLLISAMGLITLLQLIRLRSAWHDSIQAMNQIKDFYIQNTPNYPLGQAFRWRTESIPSKSKTSSISFLLTLEVSLLGTLAFGAAISFLVKAFSASQVWLGLLAGPLFLAVQLLLYFRSLQTPSGK
jgi:hypothetical protein